MIEHTGPTMLMTGPHSSGARVAGPDQIEARILVVDDDPRNLMVVEEILRAPGLKLVLAESGEDALRQVLQDDFAVILLDVQMPRIDGYEVASLIRSRPRSSRVPILFLTAFNKDDMHVFRGYSAGAVDYVFKPIEPLILRSKVDVFVDLYRKTEEIRRQGEEEKRLLVENLKARGDKLRAEQALRRREEHQGLVLQSLPIALYTAPMPQDHRELHFTNESVQKITGFGPRDFLSGPSFWADRIHPDDRDRVLAELMTIEETGAVTLEYRWRCADGADRFFLDQAVLMRDDAGRPRELFGMWFDVTERKQLEQSLLHASKLEAVGRLTGGIAHDFNNMLSVVIGNLDLLQKSIEGNERAQRRVQFAIEGAQRCADLTQRLLAFSRRQPLQAKVVDLDDLIPGMLELMRRTLGEQVEVRLEGSPGTWHVEVDEAQLEAALLNLAVNARDAMPDGGSLTVGLENRVVEEGSARGEAGDYAAISVTDTGVGMPPHVMERVFEPFFTTKETGKGTGLGLSMVYGFVQQSGGYIEVDSAQNRGTTIRLFLPRAKGNVQPAEGSRADGGVADGAFQAPFGEGRTVLVVEDDPAVRQVAVSTLGSLGFTVREAESGEAAAEMLRDAEEVSLVLSDVRMPGSLSGLDLARMAREEWPGVTVLLTSGYVDAHDQIGDFAFIHKPYRAFDLAERIRALGLGEAPAPKAVEREVRDERIAARG